MFFGLIQLLHKNIMRSILILCMGLILPISAQAKELPLWELGLGAGLIHQPYYAGTDDTRTVGFPVVLPIYRGDILKSDEKGLRAQLFDDERYKLDLSLDFNFSIDSDDVDLREGMDDIDSMLQIGPSLEIKLAETESSRWELNLPVRANFAIDSDHIEASGFTFSPNVTYKKDFNWGNQDMRAGFSIGPQFGSHKYQNVYYGVDQEFATANRPEYTADSGYSGSRMQISLRSRDENNLWVWFVRYENIDGAEFDDSPLVETDDAFSAGFIYSRFLFKSKETVNK